MSYAKCNVVLLLLGIKLDMIFCNLAENLLKFNNKLVMLHFHNKIVY